MARGYVDFFNGMEVNDPSKSVFTLGKLKLSVIHLRFSGLAEACDSVDTVRLNFLTKLMDEALRQHGIDISKADTPARALRTWMTELRKNGLKVVLLIEECDMPVTTFLPQSPATATAVAAGVLTPFFETMKACSKDFHKVCTAGLRRAGSAVSLSLALLSLPTRNSIPARRFLSQA